MRSMVPIQENLIIQEATEYPHGVTVQQKMERIRGRVDIDTVPIWEKVNLTIKEAAEYSNIGINRIEELLKKPNCSFVLYVGKKKLVKRREFERFLSGTVEI